MSNLDSYQIVLADAKLNYRVATAAYWRARDAGDIRPLDPSVKAEREAMRAGAKFMGDNGTGAAVLEAWQRAKAELDGAHENVARELGNSECPQCATTQRKMNEAHLPSTAEIKRIRGVADLVAQLAEAKS